MSSNPIQSNPILFLLTGGTIDSYYSGMLDTAVTREHSVVPNTVNILKLHYPVEYQEICMKDSRSILLEDRKNILKAIEDSDSYHIIVTHGTYTMCDSARFVKKNSQGLNKVVIFTGSMIPLEGFSPTDGGFNLGFAVAELFHQKAGVYLAMNGKIFDPDEVVKQLNEGRFDSIFGE